ncbi:MAG: glycosyltransferase family protein [Burkholderiales bacterium]|nr:glycosyltransferase family protein [Burkholderiales bacterium]
MKTAAIIQARMGSTRLPNKVLMPVLGRPLLGWMLERVSTCAEVTDIIVATTTDARDDVIARFVEDAGYKVYRGSEDDVLDRYYQAAQLVQPDAVARITADCPLLDPKVLGSLIRRHADGGADFVSNSEPLPSSWPDGMDVSIIGFGALRRAWSEAVKPSDREHVTFYFWNHPEAFTCERVDHDPDWSKYRITIDYPEDFELLKAIIEHFSGSDAGGVNRVSMDEIVAFLDANPAVFGLNEKYTRGLGWKPALERDKQLGFE